MASKRLTEKERDELESLMEVRDPHFTAPMQGSITRVHGFLTSVISGPLIVPSEWIPFVFGDDGDYPWETMEQAQRAMDLLMRFYNDVCSELGPGGRRYTIMIDRISDESGALDLADDWCAGYVLGVRLRHDEWREAIEAPELYAAFAPIVALAEPDKSPELDPVESPKVYAAMRGLLPDCAVEIYEWWRTKFTSSDPQPAAHPGTIRRSAPKVSANAPCPCGSGLKFKRCCSTLRSI